MFNYTKKQSRLCAVMFLTTLAVLGVGGNKALYADDSSNYKTGEIIVKYKNGVTRPQNSAFFVDGDKLSVEYIDDNHSYYYVNDAKMEDLLEKCNSNPEIEYAQPNYKYSIENMTSDPYVSYEWGLDKINAQKVWDINSNDAPPAVAIVDTGVNVEHADLKSNVVSGYNVIDGTTDVADDCGHGTHIAGIAAAVTNNGTGIAGVSGNSKIVPVKVLDKDGNGYSSDIALGIKWAADQNVKIINLSLGGSSYDNYLKEAVEYATKKGCIVVAAAGNKGSYRPTYPAAFEDVIAVTAVDNDDQLCNFSNFGRYVDIAAPGLDIYSTSKDGGYEYRSGTSMACAFVSGTIALVWGGAPEKTPKEIQEIIKASANKVDISPIITYDIGSGVIDAYSAYKMAKEETSDQSLCTLSQIEQMIDEKIDQKLDEKLLKMIDEKIDQKLDERIAIA